MSTNVETPSSAMESVKWLVAIALLAGAVVGNHMFADQSVLLRAIGVVVAIAAGLGIASQTAKGRDFLAFAKEARIEVRKVVWPTRQEAIQTTGIVLFATFIMSLVMWGLDSTLFWVVGFITGLQV